MAKYRRYPVQVLRGGASVMWRPPHSEHKLCLSA